LQHGVLVPQLIDHVAITVHTQVATTGMTRQIGQGWVLLGFAI